MIDLVRPDVVAVLPDFNGGGAQRVALTLMNELAKQGRRVTVLVFNGVGPLATMPDQQVVVEDLKAERLRSAIFAMVRRLRETAPRIVFSTLGYVNITLSLSRSLLPAQSALWLREANLPSISLSKGRFGRLTRAAYRLLYPQADLLICSSGRMRSEFITDFGIPQAKLRVLPNPVDVERLRGFASLTSIKPSPGRNFVAVGRLTEQKGFDRLIRMFAELNDPVSQLRILGDGPLAASLRAEAVRLDVADRIHFHGFVSNPWQFFSMSDALLLPSRWEGMPNVALEALALGVPVIATPESGGIAELAGQAAPGSVNVTDAGANFVLAMRRVIRNHGTELRPSLLPDMYKLDAVMLLLEDWLDGIC